MNLSKKQLEVLVDEIYKDIYPAMEKRVNELKQELKDELYKKLWFLKEAFLKIDFIWFKYFVVDRWAILQSIWYEDFRTYTTDVKTFDGFIDWCVSDLIRREYNKKYWKDIEKTDIERIVVLETIWAKNVDELIEAVTNKLNV